jgi:hypothetical protein
MQAAILAVLTAALLPAPGAVACPAYIGAGTLPAGTSGIRRDMKVFALQAGSNGIRTWKSLAAQVDPLDEKGVLRADPEGSYLADQGLESNDRILVRREQFGLRLTPEDKAPCDASSAVELRNPEQGDQYAYLVFCRNAGDFAFDHPTPVTIDQKQFKIAGPTFEYDYQPNNQLMYKSLIAKGKYPQPSAVAAADADVNIHMDIKRFFTMDFTNKNVESYVTSNRSGPVGTVGSINFFLRLLFFKIDLKMATTVGFYEDSGHIPSIIDVPRDAPKMLNPGSGLMYLWTTKAAEFDQTSPEKTMPFVDAKSILAGWEEHARTGLRYCHGTSDTCNFRLRGKVVGEAFGLDINVPRNLVERGFFPVWVPSVSQFKKDMAWDSSPDETPGVVGIYFENGGLLKGQYKLEQWLRIGDQKDIASTCPRPVGIGDAVSFGPSSAPDVAH